MILRQKINDRKVIRMRVTNNKIFNINNKKVFKMKV